MDNLLEEIDKNIAADQEMLSLLPKNNKKNKDAYLEKVLELRKKYKLQKRQVAIELKNRYHQIKKKRVTPNTLELEEKLEKYDGLYLLNDENTSFEKMGLDKIVYDLSHFYKSDLNLINDDILKSINAFKKCNINLTPSDFNYSQFTYKYMKVFFEEIKDGQISSDNIRDIFEEIYWSCSEIILHIELNIRYLYLKNEKEIEKYYKIERNKFASEFKSKDIIEDYKNLKEEIANKKQKDNFVLLKKFINQELDIDRFADTEIKGDYSKIIKQDIDLLAKEDLENVNDNIYKLSNTLNEYKNYLKFVYIVEDMKKRFAKNGKTTYAVDKELKTIFAEEKKLIKMNNKINKIINKPKRKILFFASKDPKSELEELTEKTNTQITAISELYKKYDEDRLNEEINKMLTDNCTIYQIFCFAASHYSYFCKCTPKKEGEEVNKDEKIKELEEFIMNSQYNILIKNIRVMENKKIEQIIKDRYSLFKIRIDDDDLKPENLEGVLQLVDKIVIYNNIKNSSIGVKDIEFMCDLKRICQK